MIHIILYQPEIPGNTGNIIRTCYATNSKLHIIMPTAFSLDPQMMKRSGAGRLLSDIEHEIHASYDDFKAKYGNQKIYYITRYGQTTYDAAPFAKEKDIFIMFGRESTGIPKPILQGSLETCLRIPMVAKERSLNLANSVIVITYEILRQHKFSGMALNEVQKGADFITLKEK